MGPIDPVQGDAFVDSAISHRIGPRSRVLLFVRIHPLGVVWLRSPSAGIVLTLRSTTGAEPVRSDCRAPGCPRAEPPESGVNAERRAPQFRTVVVRTPMVWNSVLRPVASQVLRRPIAPYGRSHDNQTPPHQPPHRP